jgi:hypothetical protein
MEAKQELVTGSLTVAPLSRRVLGRSLAKRSQFFVKGVDRHHCSDGIKARP